MMQGIQDISTLRWGERLPILRRILANLRPYLLVIGLLLIITLVQQLIQLVYPQLIRILIDDVFIKRDTFLIHLIFLVTIGLFTIQNGYEFLSNYVGYYLENRVQFDVRKRFFDHLQSLSVRFYEEHPLEEISYTESQNLRTIQNFLITSLQTVSSQVLQIALSAGMLFLIEPRLALASLPVIPFWIWATIFFWNKLAPIGQRLNEQYINVQGVFNQFVLGIQLVKAYARELFEKKRYFRELATAANMGFDQLIWSSLATTVLGSLSVLLTAFVFWFGGLLVVRGDMSIGQIVAFNIYLGSVLPPLTGLVGFYRQINDVLIAALRVYSIWDVQPEITDRPGAIAPVRLEGHVEFRNVSFAYRDTPVLDTISFEAPANTMVAFVGGSGSGKSTIVKLLTRFYDPQAGKIFIDGLDLRDLQRSAYLRHVALVAQSSFMLHDTVANNIRYGRLEATDEEVVTAAKLAQAYEFIMALPQGFDTVIGMGGVGLSGGQMQRIAIARALIRDPRILILDEATSALDTQTEMLIKTALDYAMQGRTSIVIAHRLSTIVNADRIYVLDRGRIVEDGRHHELLDNNGVYAALWRQQQAPERPDILVS